MDRIEGYAKDAFRRALYGVKGELQSFKAPLVVLRVRSGCIHDLVQSLKGFLPVGRAVTHSGESRSGCAIPVRNKDAHVSISPLFFDDSIGIADRPGILCLCSGGCLHDEGKTLAQIARETGFNVTDRFPAPSE
jgi:hypothetical protein